MDKIHSEKSDKQATEVGINAHNNSLVMKPTKDKNGDLIPWSSTGYWFKIDPKRWFNHN